MEEAQLREFEAKCTAALGPDATPAERAAASEEVQQLGTSLEYIPTIQAILDGSDNDYAVVAAARCLLTLVGDHWNAFSPAQRVDVRNYLLTLIANKGPKLQSFSVMMLVEVVCRLTKFAWFDEGSSAIREIVSETNKFLQATFQHCIIGMKLLTSLVAEMNYKNTNRTLTQHRKVAVSFRDVALLEVFEVSLSMLSNLATRALPFGPLTNPQEAVTVENQLLNLSLELFESCLNFDFIGVLPDESGDDANSLQVPSTWGERLKNGATLRLLFNIYKGSTIGKIPLIPDQAAPAVGVASSSSSSIAHCRDFHVNAERAAQTLDCLSLMISVRRSLFPTDAERRRFLTHIIRGVYEILREDQGLGDDECYHRFCRLLSRIKSNYPLTDLIHVEGYSEWLALTAKFTIASCQNPTWSANSMHYILGLWAKLVSGVPYANATGAAGITGDVVNAGALLGDYVPQVVGAYVGGRLEQLTGESQGEALDALADIEQVEDQLENLPVLCRFQYPETAEYVKSLLDPHLTKYSDALAAMRQNLDMIVGDGHVLATFRLLECHLAWLVYVVGAIISGGGASSMAGSGAGVGDEAHDAELIRRVLTLLGQTDELVRHVVGDMAPADALQHPYLRVVRIDHRLELALLYFTDQFRRAFINDASGMPAPLPSSATDGPSAASLLLRSVASTSSSSSGAGNNNNDMGGGMIGAGGGGGSSSNAAVGKTGLLKGNSLMNGGGAASSSSGSSSSNSSSAKVHGGPPRSYADLLETATGRQRNFLHMFESIGLGEHDAVVEMLLLKLANNLRYWGSRDTIIRRSLDVLHELVYSYSSGRLLLSLPSIDSLLQNHGPDRFPFLAVSSNARHRTAFYKSLARLVFFQDDSEKFEPFIAPILSVMSQLGAAFEQGIQSEEIISHIMGCARDLRGVVSAAHNRASYLQVFEALHPTHLETFVRALHTWPNQPMVTTPILKLMAELVDSRAQRIQFGSNSPNGILLFKTVSQAVVSYAKANEAVQPASDSYTNKYKGAGICAQILGRCMDGGFVNFGVFQLYKDKSFDEVLDATLKLLLSIPIEEVMVHQKLAVHFMALVNSLCRSHIDTLANLPDTGFLYIIRLISEGIDSLHMLIADQASHALDYLASSFVKNAKKDTPTAVALRQQVLAADGIFQTLMKILFQILMFSENGNKYSLARPVLPVILAAEMIEPQVLDSFKEELEQSQPDVLQARMNDEFVNLVKDISRSLDPTNRDKFVQRLSSFSASVREFAIM